MGVLHRPKITAIIPAFNEEATIAHVVEVVISSPLIDECFVVSDGSTDHTAEIARRARATQVFERSTCGGKGAAMLYAVAQTDAAILVFFDADLRGLTTYHIERLVLPVISGAKAMNVGLRDRGMFWTNFSRYLPLISGERALIRRIVDEIPPEYVQGFMVEVALNYFCKYHKLRYGSVFLPGLSIRRKYEKVGIKKAAGQYIHMFFQILTAMFILRMARIFKQF